MSDFKSIKFDNKNSEFVKVLRKKVNEYFKEKNISKHANFNMFVKTLFMISKIFFPRKDNDNHPTKVIKINATKISTPGMSKGR